MNKYMFLLCVIFMVSGNSSSEHLVTLLQGNIFKDYKADVRPVLNHADPVQVTLGLSLKKIQSVDEIRQSFTATVNLLVYWKDELLTWNKTDYNGISLIVFPYHKHIWIPDILINNALDTPEDVGFEDNYVRLYSNGQVFFWTQTNINTACEIKTKKYPLDEQLCKIDIGKFIYADDMVMLRSLENGIGLGQYTEIAEWEIEETFVTSKINKFNVSRDILNDTAATELMNFTVISFNIKLRRTCLSCLINVILPVVVLAVLNLLSFFVPCESGEKTSFPVSIFLTLAVFLTIITQSLPESIDGVSYLSSYVAFQLSVSAMTLLSAIISMQIHYKTGNKFGREAGTQNEKANKCNISGTFDKLMFLFLLLCEVITTAVFLGSILN